MMAAKVAAVFVTSQTPSSATTHNMYLTLLTDLSVSVLMPRVIFLTRQFCNHFPSCHRGRKELTEKQLEV